METTFKKGSPEPDRSWVLSDSDGDSWWYNHEEGGWQFSSYPENIGTNYGQTWARTWEQTVGDNFCPFRYRGRMIDGVYVPDAPIEVTEPLTISASALQDSGARTQYAGGGVRDSSEGKPRFDLLWPKDVPYEAQFLTQMAQVLQQGAEKYEPRNWELFHTPEALEHAQASLGRHYANYMAGSKDEPHLFQMGCNLLMIATIEWKIANGWKPEKGESDGRA